MSSDESTLEEAARQLGCPLRWLRAAVDAGRIEAFDRDGVRFVLIDDVRRARQVAKQSWRNGGQ